MELNIFRGGSRGRMQEVRTPTPSPPEMTCGFLIQLVFCKKKTMWFIGVEVEQETSSLPPKKLLFYHYDNQLERLSSSGCCALTDHVSLLVITICLFFLLCLNDVQYVVIYGNSANKQ